MQRFCYALFAERQLATRQNILILYLSSSNLDAPVVGWSRYFGFKGGAGETMAGDSSEPPYSTGLAALRDGWRLIQMSPLLPHAPGNEFTTAYLKYEFLFEQLVDVDV
jgi:hypothetical protein